MRKLAVFAVVTMFFNLGISVTPVHASSDDDPALFPAKCPAGFKTNDPRQTKIFKDSDTSAGDIRTYLVAKAACPNACWDVSIELVLVDANGVDTTGVTAKGMKVISLGKDKCTPGKKATEQNPPRGCGNKQSEPSLTTTFPSIPGLGSIFGGAPLVKKQTIGPKTRCKPEVVANVINNTFAKLKTQDTSVIPGVQDDLNKLVALPEAQVGAPVAMAQDQQNLIKNAFTDAPEVVTAAKQNDPATFNKLLECQTNGCSQAKIDEYSNKLGLTINSDTASKWVALAASNPDATATVPPSGPDQTKPEETFQDPEAKKRDFGFPTDPTHTLPASIDNAARLACEYQTAQGRSCDPTSAAAVGNAIVQMETGGRNPTCTGSYCGWGQLGSNETRWALQEVNKWANSDSLTPEAKAYAQSLMTRAEQIGANYGALNADPALGPALLMARLSNTRLSDADPGTPALTNIQAMTDDVRTQAKLGFLNQFMPAGWSGGQMQNWDAPLSGGMQSAIGNQYQRIGATTVNQALATMDTMSKYVNPINAGVQNYNNYLSAVGAGQVEFTSAAPAVRNSPFSFTGNNDNGYLAPLAGYGSSPFANANPAPFQNQQTYQPNNTQSYQQPSSNGGSNYQQASYGSGSYQQGAYTGGNTYAQADYVTHIDATSTSPAVASIIIQPTDVARGGSYRISWSSVGMSLVNPCQIVQPDLTVVSISNEGSKLITTRASSTEDIAKYSLRCVSAGGQRIERSASVRIH